MDPSSWAEPLSTFRSTDLRCRFALNYVSSHFATRKRRWTRRRRYDTPHEVRAAASAVRRLMGELDMPIDAVMERCLTDLEGISS